MKRLVAEQVEDLVFTVAEKSLRWMMFSVDRADLCMIDFLQELCLPCSSSCLNHWEVGQDTKFLFPEKFQAF